MMVIQHLLPKFGNSLLTLRCILESSTELATTLQVKKLSIKAALPKVKPNIEKKTTSTLPFAKFATASSTWTWNVGEEAETEMKDSTEKRPETSLSCSNPRKMFFKSQENSDIEPEIVYENVVDAIEQDVSNPHSAQTIAQSSPTLERPVSVNQLLNTLSVI